MDPVLYLIIGFIVLMLARSVAANVHAARFRNAHDGRNPSREDVSPWVWFGLFAGNKGRRGRRRARGGGAAHAGGDGGGGRDSGGGD